MGDALQIIAGVIFLAGALGLLGLSLQLRKLLRRKNEEIIKEREEAGRRLYEIAILKEIGDRTGYSLDVGEVLKIIAGSLHQFIEYSAVSYIVIDDGKYKLNTYLESSVDKTFLSEMKQRMIASLSALLDKAVEESFIEEDVSGAISLDDLPQKVGSFFNIPIVISGKLSGLLTIAHIKPGLYKEADMTILYKITAQASNAVTRLEEVVQREEEKVLKVREEYTSMIVHELRSPLDGVKKIVELMATGKIKPTSKEFGEYIKLVYQSSSSMLELVNDILDYSKLQAGKFEISKSPANIKSTIENRVEFYKISADTKKILLSSTVGEGVPSSAEFDEQAIKQVLNNFISNALKFTPEGGSVIVSAELKDKSILVKVTDTGMGIAAEKQKDLFMKYKQANRSPIYSEDKGTGLGLVIAKGIIESHGGSVGVASSEHEGSTFYFTIPLE